MIMDRGSSSLPEVHASVPTTQASFLRRLFAFAGPAYLVSVGYMDPGNWATDLEGGARFGYQLLWVLVMSNFMAILLQTLSARLGIAAGRDLAQACRESYPRPISYALWVLCEIAITACDLAEVLGAAIGLNLLFGLPMLIGVLVTAADTLFILWFTRFGIRNIEAFVIALVTVIGVCFGVEILLAKPVWGSVFGGLVPRLSNESLYVAIGILGATVMPHNLYLHSALVQTRRIGTSETEKRQACHFNFIDSVVALNGALLVNAAILVLAGTVFFQRGIVVTEIAQAHVLLEPLLGTAAASALFAIALICSGQSSTLTGTMAGQIVMEGFLNFRMRPWLRRLITRMLAVIPAAITIWLAGDKGTYQLLILSQVVLSLQLPFAVIPLIHFTSDSRWMGNLRSKLWVRLLAWVTAVIIVGLNVRLVMTTVGGWLEHAGALRTVVALTAIPFGVSLGLLLLWVTFEPYLPPFLRRFRLAAAAAMPAAYPKAFEIPVYTSLLVPLDHTDGDRAAVAHAAAIARQHNAKVYLLHIEEDVTSQVYGSMSSSAEVEHGREYLEGIASALRAQGVEVEALVRYASSPRKEIVKQVETLNPDLLIMGAHGHAGLKDLIFGTTINAVRHHVKVPLLVVKEEPKHSS
jgi:manganese transport protein